MNFAEGVVFWLSRVVVDGILAIAVLVIVLGIALIAKEKK